MRQDYYGHRFGDGSYTPEMVVDGMVGLVGSHRDEVNAAIEHAKRGQHTATDVNVDKAGENGSDRESVAEGSYSSGSTTSTRRKSAAAKMAAGRSQNPTWSGQFVRSANGQASLLKSASNSRKATSIVELEKSPHTQSTNENADHAWKYQKSKRLGRLELVS